MALNKGNIDWQSRQVVGYPGTAQTWDGKGNQCFERRALYCRTDLQPDPDFDFAIRPLMSL